MDNTAFKYLGAGVAMIGALGGGIGLGLIFSAWISALARNPAGENGYRTIGLIGADYHFLSDIIAGRRAPGKPAAPHPDSKSSARAP